MQKEIEMTVRPDEPIQGGKDGVRQEDMLRIA